MPCFNYNYEHHIGSLKMNNTVEKKQSPINPTLARTSRMVVAGALGIILALTTIGVLTAKEAAGYLIILLIVAVIQFSMAVTRMTQIAIQEEYVPEKSKAWDVIKRFNKDVQGLNEDQGVSYRKKHENVMKCVDQIAHFGLCGFAIFIIWLISASISFFS